MLRLPTLSLVAVGLITLLCACSSSDSGAPAQSPGDQDAAEEVLEQDAATEPVEEAAAEAGEDALPEAAVEAAEAAVKKCPYESDLSKATLPCMCGTTLVEDVETAMPGCTGIVKCCPAEGGLKCE